MHVNITPMAYFYIMWMSECLCENPCANASDCMHVVCMYMSILMISKMHLQRERAHNKAHNPSAFHLSDGRYIHNKYKSRANSSLHTRSRIHTHIQELQTNTLYQWMQCSACTVVENKQERHFMAFFTAMHLESKLCTCVNLNSNIVYMPAANYTKLCNIESRELRTE